MSPMYEDRLTNIMSTIPEGEEIAIFPYGDIGRQAEQYLKETFGITPPYIIDNFAKDEGCLTLQAFSDIYQPSKVKILFMTTDFALFNELLRELFVAGINARDVKVLRVDFVHSYEAMEWLLNHQGEYKTILDVGCGDGSIGRYFEDYGFDVTGLTMSDEVDYSGACLSKVLKQNFLEYEGGPIMARLSRQKSDDFIVNQAAAFAASSNMAGKYASAGGMSPIAEWQRS